MTDDPRVKAIEELVKQVQDAFAREQALWEKQNSAMMAGVDSGYSAWVQKWRDNHDASRRWAPELAGHLAFLLEDRQRLLNTHAIIEQLDIKSRLAVERAEAAESEVARLKAVIAAAETKITEHEAAERGAASGIQLQLHPETKLLVLSFAKALAEKLYAAEVKYGYEDGWRSADWMDLCRKKLRAHLDKGDPRDVAAYCAFLWYHGESTVVSQAAAPSTHAALIAEAEEWLADTEPRSFAAGLFFVKQLVAALKGPEGEKA